MKFLVFSLSLLIGVPAFSFTVLSKNLESGGGDKIICLQRMQDDCESARQTLKIYLRLIHAPERKLGWTLLYEKYDVRSNAAFCEARCVVDDSEL